VGGLSGARGLRGRERRSEVRPVAIGRWCRHWLIGGRHGASVALAAREALAQVRYLPPAHRERLAVAAQLELVAAVCCAIEAGDVRYRDEQAPVDPNEVPRELVLELAQGLVDEILAVRVPNGHV